MIRYKLDQSTTGVVGVCREEGCGVRAHSPNLEAAKQARADHEERCHMKRGRITTRRADKGIRAFASEAGY